MINFPGIEKACLEMAYDNGAITRVCTEEDLIKNLKDYIQSEASNNYDNLQEISDWLYALGSEDLSELCCGEEKEQVILLRDAPVNTDELLNDVFDNVC